MNEDQIVNITLDMLARNNKFRPHFQHMMKLEDKDLDGQLYFQVPDDWPTFNVQVKRELRQYQIPSLQEMAKLHEPFMVMAENIFPTIKERLRNLNINYVDTAGNIFIHQGQKMIWIGGHKLPIIPKTGTNKAFTKAGLKVVFYLLLYEQAINFTYRGLAHATGVALGNIKNVFEGLREAGFLLAINKSKYKLQNKKELLHRWITAYGETLRPALFIDAYNFWDKKKFNNWNELPFEMGESMWGGEPGGDLLTNYLKPQTLLLYTNQKAKLVTEWTLIPNKDGVIRMYQKFWKDEAKDHERHAPPLLVYADLILTGDPHCEETAAMIYDKYLKHEFE